VQFGCAGLFVFFLSMTKPDMMRSISDIIDWIIIGLIVFAVPSGIVAGALFKSITEENWLSFLFAVSSPVSLALFAFFAMIYLIMIRPLNESLSFPFHLLFGVCCLNFVLTLTGTGLSLQLCGFQNGRDINQIPRQIPDQTFWQTGHVQAILVGLLLYLIPAANIHTLMIAGWMNGISVENATSLCINFVCFLIVTLFVGTIFTFLKLWSEDFGWWWSSYRSAAAVGAVFFIYTVWFGAAWHLSDTRSILIFVLVSASVGVILSILAGAFSFLGGFVIVQLLYRSLKFE
jgi:transmembrane 9 superfamily protein 2/4